MSDPKEEHSRALSFLNQTGRAFTVSSHAHDFGALILDLTWLKKFLRPSIDGLPLKSQQIPSQNGVVKATDILSLFDDMAPSCLKGAMRICWKGLGWLRRLRRRKRG